MIPLTRLTPEQRYSVAKAIKQGKPIKLVAEVFGISQKSARYWAKEDLRADFSDLPRNTDEGKITVEVEVTILYLRTSFGWGTERIRKGLLNLPPFVRQEMEVCVQNVSLSRTAINNVLTKHGINGYRREQKGWKFFRAEKPNELWQLDVKGPFKVEGKKYWMLVCIDDHSRYLLLMALFEHEPSIEQIERTMLPLFKRHKPQSILTDNSPFKQNWAEWCDEQKVTALFAHPYYPQDKGKVERVIRTIAEEFIALLGKFPKWLKRKRESYRRWYNTKRYHCGIKTYPAALYGT